MKWCSNRMTVLGSKRELQVFIKSRWATALGARHCELLENSPGRFACQFETEDPPLESLKRLSRRAPRLVLLLDFEVEESRMKGLAKAVAGKLEHCEIGY